MDWVLVHIHQGWRWEQLLNSSLCIQLTCYWGISHGKLDRLHFLILFRADHEYLTLVPIQESSWRNQLRPNKRFRTVKLSHWQPLMTGEWGGRAVCWAYQFRNERGKERERGCYLSQSQQPSERDCICLVNIESDLRHLTRTK